MTIKIYNTMTRTKEEFVPVQAGKVSIYVCGPTVYNYIHIGNARPAVFFDVVRRYFKHRGYEVTYVQNFTDVDDKLIRRAEEEGATVPELSKKYISAFLEDAKQLNILAADYYPQVTEHVEEIIQFINSLIEKGYAYAMDGDVYFRTEHFAEYGKLSHQPLQELKAGARVELNESKENPLDFALWKKAKTGEITWQSPWGMGRPGWHIECSTLAKRYLGETIDIHGGGTDLTFPHHENEIAQSESLTGKPMAKYWMHNGMLNMGTEKMSKSLNNSINVHQLLESYPGKVLRFFLLSAHYRTPLTFSGELLEQQARSLERIEMSVSRVKERLAEAPSGNSTEMEMKIEEWSKRFYEKMDDDFNTADAISVIFDAVKDVNNYLDQEVVFQGTLEAILAQFSQWGNILGFHFETDELLLEEEVEALIRERNEARKARDFAKADDIRDRLAQMNIILEDTPQGVRWRRK